MELSEKIFIVVRIDENLNISKAINVAFSMIEKKDDHLELTPCEFVIWCSIDEWKKGDIAIGHPTEGRFMVWHKKGNFYIRKATPLETFKARKLMGQ